jgi:hypothetical protein
MQRERIAGVILLALAAAAPCIAQPVSTPAGMSSRFIGTWKENESRRKLASTPVLQFQTNADGLLEELRGGPTPFTQTVHLNGVPYQVAPEDVVTWKQAGPGRFERQSVLRGQLSSIRRIAISNGGNTLTEETERHLPGRVSLITALYSRTSGGGAGLAGSWTLKSLRSDKPEQIVLSGIAMNTLLYTNSTTGMTYTATLDNRPVPVTGPGVAAGSTIALLRQLDDYTIVSTLSRNGVVTGNGLITISPDGKVMTTTTTNVGRGARNSPSIRVWEKQ